MTELLGAVDAASRVATGLVFLVAAVAKLRDLGAFTRSLHPFLTVPAPVYRVLAATVVAAELAAAALVAVPATAVWGFALALALTAAFAVGIGRVLRRGVQAVCNCFGVADSRLSRRHLVRDLLLAVPALAGLAAAAAGTRPQSPVQWLAGTAVGALCALLVIRFEDLADLFAPARKGAPVRR
ncbi:MauE/DoxX family redox-associated membrane protein [Catellatospora sp. KI3]|uniref:MauE/DoxX family redox-associated membrane protein n=1 Tax=Catellatospora sp. KI3 TaxID=3041620 RepID=UPI0024824645|nr:MauE/DoxX family redox-associated membrane protein [Catellatospora sp. KI3]MDI1461428.1 MauE/DoxX family redox-associated membrane protein [Catellatospora sp. KI3]